MELPKIAHLKIETSAQKNLIENIKFFNKHKYCSCCERHSTKKPVDMNDFRMGNCFNEGDSRNITGTIELVADDEKIDTMAEKHPRVHVFQNSSQNFRPLLMTSLYVNVGWKPAFFISLIVDWFDCFILIQGNVFSSTSPLEQLLL